MLQDYYEALQLDQAATITQIQQQYRKLALRNHPSSTKEHPLVAQEAFANLAESYQVLSDPVKRAYYDKHGYTKFKESFYEVGGLQAGYRFIDTPLDVFNQFFKQDETSGSIVDLHISKQGTLFGHAHGGLQDKEVYYCQDLWVPVQCSLEELFKGCSKIVAYQRKVINQDGRTTSKKSESKMVHIKPGYKNGTVIKFEKEGHETIHRTVSTLYFKIVELQHPKYQLKNGNLIYNHHLSLADALDCRPVDMITLDGRFLRIPIDSIASPGTLWEVPKEGWPGSDNQPASLFIRFHVSFPAELSNKVRGELRKLIVD